VRPVNLLPARYRPRTGGSGDSKTAYIALGVLGALVLAVFVYVSAANKVSSQNSEIAETRQQLAAAQSQAVTLQGFGDFAGVKEARLSAVKSLATARIDWERLFRELAHVLPSRVWLTGFNSQAAEADGGGELGPAMTLKGCAESHERIADAMVRLRELHVAEDVELTQTMASEDKEQQQQPTGFGAPAPTQQSSDSGCGSFYSFEMSVAMSPPSSVAADSAAPVPARLGGGG
jgi:Tfp pilus assembly protein PilN